MNARSHFFNEFNIRDLMLLESDLNKIMNAIENHREKKEKKKVKPVLNLRQ